MQQMAHGYGCWNYPEVYDATIENGSWAQTGGAMVSTPEDLVKWMQALFTSNKITGAPITDYLQLKNTVTGKKVTSYNQTGYSFGLFRMNTPGGIIWFTPGLTPGYMTAMVYAPCQNIFFAYSTNKALVKGLHGHVITNILSVINNNQAYKEFLRCDVESTKFCAKIKPAKKFIFPVIAP